MSEFSQSAPDQAARDRIDTDLQTDLLVAAGAGSGKTTKLVDRYLALLDAGFEPATIAVVTFTRRAAGEMRARIRRRLRARAREATDEAQKARFIRLAREVETAPIQTIDAFCLRLLRAEALSAGLDPSFEILDEAEADALLRQTAAETLRALLAEDDPAAAALHDVHYSFGDLVSLVASGLSRRRLWLNPYSDPPAEPVPRQAWRYLRGEEEAPPTEAEWLDHLRQQRLTGVRASLADAECQALVAALRKVWRQLADFAGPDGAGDAFQPVYEAGQQLPAEVPGEDPEQALSALLAVAGGRLNAGRATAWGPGLAAAREVMKALRAWIDDDPVLADPPEALASVARATAALHPVLRAAERRLEERKLARGALAFDDLLLRTAALIASSEGQEVLLRIRERYRRVLVDEYQDTDGLQDKVLRELAGGRPGAFFAVGDDKQSIYGFRGAELAVFNRARAAAGDGLVPLTATFRLTPALAEALNRWFADDEVMGATPHDEPDAAVFAPLQALNAPERVTLDGPPVRVLAVRAGNGKRADSVALEAAAVAEDICRLVVRERPEITGPDGRRGPLNYGGIAVLFRAGTHAEAYRDALRARGIPVRTDRGQLCRRQEVLDLMALGRWLESPSDAYSLLAVLRSPFVRVSDEILYWVARGRTLPEAVAEALSDEKAAEASYAQIEKRVGPEAAERWGEAMALLNEWRAQRQHRPLAEVLRLAVDQSGYLAVLEALPESDRRLANVEVALDELARLEARGVAGSDALATLEDRRDGQPRQDPEGSIYDADAEAVSLLTIHGAKGLEWPVVYFVDLAHKPDQRHQTVEAAPWHGVVLAAGRDQEEKAYLPAFCRSGSRRARDFEAERLLYVACTRARDRLVLCASVAVKDGAAPSLAEDSWLGLLAKPLGLDLGAEAPLPATDLWCGEWAEPSVMAPPFDALQRLAQLDALAASDPAPPARVIDSFRDAAKVWTIDKLVECVGPQTMPADFVPMGLPEAEIVSGGLSAKQRGDLLHEVLRAAAAARCEPTPHHVRVAAAALGIELARGDDDPAALVEALCDTARRGYAMEAVRRALGCEQVLIEAPFVLHDRTVYVQGRIDLAGVQDGEVLLVDYKTGRPNDPARQWAYHCETSLYAYALARRYSGRRLSVVLAMVDLDLVIEGRDDYESIAAQLLERAAVTGQAEKREAAD